MRARSADRLVLWGGRRYDRQARLRVRGPMTVLLHGRPMTRLALVRELGASAEAIATPTLGLVEFDVAVGMRAEYARSVVAWCQSHGVDARLAA